MTTTAESTGRSHGTFKSLVPARLDRLPWTRFHWLVVVGLGVSWILDGLEVQLVSLNGFKDALGLTSAQVGLVGTVYLIGQIVGALFFGRITDRFGRKRMFILTLAIYLIGSGLGGLSFSLWFLLATRFIAGMGIGGEYTAINSAIDELIPSHYRGRVDIAVNGTYWAGAALGSAAGLVLLNDSIVSANWGWRIAFFLGPVIGLVIIFLRRAIPESPRWQMTHGFKEQAERTVDDIEQRVRNQGIELQEVPERKALEVKPTDSISYLELLRIFVKQMPSRTFLGASMMITQSFLYNAIFFTYALVLTNFYDISKDHTAYYFFPFALGNLIGPILLGHLFDTVGRRKMILSTYGISGVLLAVSAWMFHANMLTATTHTIFWSVIFFFASAGASSAYLTVSEIFPIEVRGQAISVFFAIGQGAGALAPVIYGALVGDGTSRGPLTIGYLVGAAIMVAGGLIAWFFGVNAERTALEDVATPLSVLRARAEGADSQGTGHALARGEW